MQDVCFIADVAVLPKWLRVSQALDYVAGVHPRFDRARAEGFLKPAHRELLIVADTVPSLLDKLERYEAPPREGKWIKL